MNVSHTRPRARRNLILCLVLVALASLVSVGTTRSSEPIAAISPSRALYFISGGEIWKTDFAGVDAVVIPTTRTPLQLWGTAPDGTLIYTWQASGSSDHNQLAVITPSGQEMFLPGADDSFDEQFVAVSPTRPEFFFYSNREGTYSIFRASTDLTEVEQVTVGPANGGDDFALLSPDGDWLLVERTDSVAGTIDALVVGREGGPPVASMRSGTQTETYPASWSPDSQQVFFSSDDPSNPDIIFRMERANRNGSDRDVLGAVLDSDVDLTSSTPASVSPDGARLIYSLDNGLYLQTLPAASFVPFVADPSSEFEARGWSPDGSLFLFLAEVASPQTMPFDGTIYDFTNQNFIDLAESVDSGFASFRPLFVGPRQILHMERESGGTTIYLTDFDTGQEREVYHHDEPAGHMAAGPDLPNFPSYVSGAAKN